jgi:micrococcal nuclease
VKKFEFLIIAVLASLVFSIPGIAKAYNSQQLNSLVKQQQNCSSAYPDFCIAPPPPDLDCKDIPREKWNFTVLQPNDPHGFDRDKDGIGCEG